MSKMGSHDPFEYLKQKLWPKERSWVKVSIWFSIIKSWGSPWFTCVQVACHISLESSWQGLQLILRYHFNQRSTQDVMGLQSRGSLNFGKFWVNLWVLGQNDICMQPLWLIIENIIKGKVVASPKSGPWWVLWIYVCLWFVRARKMFQLHINQLVVWFVQVHVNNWPTCHSS